MPGPLGCENEYQAVLHQKGGASSVARLSPLVEVEWNRRLSEVSLGRVVIGKRGVTADCCAALAAVSPWAFELSLYRGQALVWQGPVKRPVETRTTFTVEAADVVSWFDVRLMPWNYFYTTDLTSEGATGPPQEAVRLVERYIRDVFQPGRMDPAFGSDDLHGLDVNLVSYLDFHYGTQTLEHSAFQVDTLGDRFNDVADDLLDFTTVGRRISIGPPLWLYKTGAVARLTEDDFTADTELAVEGDGLATRYRAYPSDYDRDWMHRDPNSGALTEPYWAYGTANATGTDAYGTHPYYGRVERVAELDVASKKQSTFDSRARTYVNRHFPAPVVLRIGDEAALHPHARVGVADLVCGSRIDVVLSQDAWCRPVAAAFLLTGVTGHWDKGGERITIALEASNEALALPEAEPEAEVPR